MENLELVDLQIEEVKELAKSMGLPPQKVRVTDGTWAMTPLLVAKVQLLHALTLLNLDNKEH